MTFQPPVDVEMKEKDFLDLSAYVGKKFGINLTENKKALVKTRLGRVFRQRKVSSFREYLESLENDTTGEMSAELINRISTNHTYFNRESDHFDFLFQKCLPEVLPEAGNVNGKIPLRLWCAGCSSGEEPYTLAMLLKENYADLLELPTILATDISEDVLAAAKIGRYPLERIEQLPERLQKKYLSSKPDQSVQVHPDLKAMILYRRLNLMDESFPFQRTFHIIFCRNVMIYFGKTERDALIHKFYRHLAPGGYLFIGHSESLDRATCPLRYVRPAVYQKAGGL